MSEYQYYEFVAIDRPLAEREMRELRAISTRAAITPTSFVNEYNWGDLKANPLRLLARYFDAFLYVANWGTRRLALRVPRQCLEPGTAAAFRSDSCLHVRSAREYTLLDFWSEDEHGDWDTGEGWLPSVVSVRADILSGDLRSLYLGWLLGVQRGDFDDEELEPVLPPGCPSLGELSAPLKALAEFLRLDEDLVAIAGEDAPCAKLDCGPDAMKDWIAALPEAEKDALLVRAAGGQGALVGSELIKSFRDSVARQAQPDALDAGRRTVAQLRERRHERAAERARREAEARAREEARHAKAQARARSGTWIGWQVVKQNSGAESKRSFVPRSRRNMTRPWAFSPTCATSPPARALLATSRRAWSD